MRLFPFIAAIVCCAGCAGGTAAEDLIPVGDHETIVMYGDSITEQNLYVAYLETFLISRFPGKALTIYNFGWSGDNACNGGSRFTRDVKPVDPTLVFVDYGMNDGGYRAPDVTIRKAYLANQRSLATRIRHAGAREVLLTTSPVDYDRRVDGDAYNETLAAMADSLIALGAELRLPVIDQFHPLRDLQRAEKARHPGFTMIPDSIHPNEVGHLAMAYEIVRGLAVPRAIGTATIDGDHGDGQGGVTVREVQRNGDALGFVLDLPFVPFFVPEPARPALALVPFMEEFNALTLTVYGCDPRARYAVLVDGTEIGRFAGEQLDRGVDVAGCDPATWSQQGRHLWEAAQARHQRHVPIWRRADFKQDGAAKPPLLAELREAESAFAREIGDSLRDTIQPKPYRIEIVRRSREASEALPTHE